VEKTSGSKPAEKETATKEAVKKDYGMSNPEDKDMYSTRGTK